MDQNTLKNVFSDFYKENIFVNLDDTYCNTLNENPINDIKFSGFIYAISNMGYFPTTLLTIFGVLTLAVGLSLKDLFSSLASGIYLSLVELYEIGDYIKISYIPTKNFDDGYVVDFNLFYTTLKNNQGTLIKIPNNKIQSNVIVNNF